MTAQPKFEARELVGRLSCQPREKACTLLVAASFFGYAKEIKRLLEARGRRVVWVEDRPSTDAATKALLRLAPSVISIRTEAYWEAIIDSVKNEPIKDVLVIKGEAMSPATIMKFRRVFPHARFTLYFWDGYRNMPKDSRAKVALFDRAMSFDLEDVENDKRLVYRPLFFLPDYENLPGLDQDIDILFFGTVHSDRYGIVKQFEKALPDSIRFEKILYVPSRILLHVRRVASPKFWGARTQEFKFTPIGRDDLLALIARSRIVLDIERAVQTGYTMRTIETLGAGKKLITTNPAVGKADFFCSENVAIIDRRRPTVEEDFLRIDYRPISPTIRHRYTLAGWLDDVLA